MGHGLNTPKEVIQKSALMLLLIERFTASVANCQTLFHLLSIHLSDFLELNRTYSGIAGEVDDQSPAPTLAAEEFDESRDIFFGGEFRDSSAFEAVIELG